MNEKDLNNINQIDMECHVIDDDDDFVVSDASADDREIQTKTGIIINFDDEETPIHKIVANTSMRNSEIDIHSDFSEDDFHDYNSIDMETKYADDEDEVTSTSNPLFIDQEPTGLISSEMLDESKKRLSFGEVEDDYWDKISSKHKKSNKKGAYNAHFHLAGNPKKEMAIFNHMMGSDSGISAPSDAGDAPAVASAGGGEGCCENLSSNNKYSKQINDLFDIIGFEVFKNSDGSIVAIDKCDILPEMHAKDLSELIIILKPYLEDCLIYPLQLTTNNNFSDYKDWVNWYTSDMQKSYPKCQQDISYCDLLANHLHECTID